MIRFHLSSAAAGVRPHYHAILRGPDGVVLKSNATHNVHKVLSLVQTQATPDLGERLNDIYTCVSSHAEDHDTTPLVILEEVELLHYRAGVPAGVQEDLSRAMAGLLVMGENKPTIMRLDNGGLGVAQLDDILRHNPDAYEAVQNLRRLIAAVVEHTKIDQAEACREVLMGGVFTLIPVLEYLESIKT